MSPLTAATIEFSGTRIVSETDKNSYKFVRHVCQQSRPVPIENIFAAASYEQGKSIKSHQLDQLLHTRSDFKGAKILQGCYVN